LCAIAAVVALTLIDSSLADEIRNLTFVEGVCLAMCFLLELFPIRFNRRGEIITYSAASTMALACVLLGVPLLAISVLCVAALITVTRQPKAKTVYVFTIAIVVIAVTAIYLVCEAFIDLPITSGVGGWRLLFMGVACGAVVDIVDFVVNGPSMRMTNRQPIREIFSISLWGEIDSILLTSLGVVVAFLAIAKPALLIVVAIIGAAAIVNSYAAIKNAEEASTDPLTKLPNRLALDKRGGSLFNTAERRKGRLTVLFMDLDGFKDVNDNLSHDAGDALLVEVARRIQSQMRGGDFACRTGGDEFAILVPSTPMERVSELANDIRRAIEEPVKIGDSTARVGASIGIATYPDDCDSFSDLLQRADFAMFEAKEQRLGVHFYSPSTEKRSQIAGAVVNALRADLERDGIDVVFQPIINISTGDVVGIETLARWKYEGRAVDPEEFVDLAEKTGTIRSLTQSVIDATVTAAKELAKEFPKLKYSINVSARDIADKAFPERVAASLNGSGIDAESISLEITEGSLVQRSRVSEGVLEALRSFGLSLILDDFGTGYASFAQLRHLPFAGLKVDRSFVVATSNTAEDQSIVELSIEAGAKLGLQVTVEGIETRETLLALAQHKDLLLQGNLLAEPMEFSELVNWLRARDTHLADVRTALQLVAK
jgi:diguanylate cyclase (GGDEF)-like protein